MNTVFFPCQPIFSPVKPGVSGAITKVSVQTRGTPQPVLNPYGPHIYPMLTHRGNMGFRLPGSNRFWQPRIRFRRRRSQ